MSSRKLCAGFLTVRKLIIEHNAFAISSTSMFLPFSVSTPMMEVENFTIFIKNSIRFPTFNYTKYDNDKMKCDDEDDC